MASLDEPLTALLHRHLLRTLGARLVDILLVDAALMRDLELAVSSSVAVVSQTSR